MSRRLALCAYALRTTLAGIASAAIALLVPSSAAAQDAPVYNWRQHDRTEAMSSLTATQNFAVELRFGLYTPDVDSEFKGKETPFADTFGTGSQLYFGAEFDYLPLRVPFLGEFGPGFGWGYVNISAPAKIAAGPDAGQDSGVSTGLAIMPMHLSAVFRADELMRRTNIPIVPYAKFGLASGYWRALGENGTSDYIYATSAVGHPKGSEVAGTGVTWGYHLALGGMLCLNFLDPHAATSLAETTGVNHAYLFAEWMNMHLDGIGSGASKELHVGASTWVVGIALDM